MLKYSNLLTLAMGAQLLAKRSIGPEQNPYMLAETTTSILQTFPLQIEMVESRLRSAVEPSIFFLKTIIDLLMHVLGPAFVGVQSGASRNRHEFTAVESAEGAHMHERAYRYHMVPFEALHTRYQMNAAFDSPLGSPWGWALRPVCSNTAGGRPQHFCKPVIL